MRTRKVLFLLGLASIVMAAVMGHIPISHNHSTSICWGYAQGRAFGKSEGDTECDPATTYADSIDGTYFPFVSGSNLSGIQPGDIVVFGTVRHGLSGHAAYVISVPQSGNTDSIRVDQVPYEGGTPEHNILLSTVKQSQGNPAGYHRGSGAATVTVTFRNSFNNGYLRIGKDKLGAWLQRPSGWSGSYYVGSELEISAIDPQEDGSGNTQRYKSWQSTIDGDLGSQNPRTVTISSSGTYTAQFEKEFSFTFQNSFPGASGGQIKINDTIRVAPFNGKVRESSPQVIAEALYQVINGMEYTFSQWNGGVTTNPRTYQITSNATYTASFTAKPQPPTSLDQVASVGQHVHLTWDDNPNDSVSTYHIYRHQVGQQRTLVATVNRGVQSWTDPYILVAAPKEGPEYLYDVCSVYNSVESDYATVSTFGTEIKISIEGNGIFYGLENESAVPAVYSVSSYPNPFNPSTTLSYRLPQDAAVSLEIYDLIGRKVKSLVDESKSAGHYRVVWNGRNETGQGVASGVYLYRYSATPSDGSKIVVRSGKLVLMR